MLFVCAVIYFLIAANQTGATILNIGVLLQEGDTDGLRAVRMAVDHVNSDKGLLRHGIKIDYLVRSVTPGQMLSVLRQTCDLTEIGVTALIGPSDCSTSQGLLSIASSLHIPLLQVNQLECPHSYITNAFTFTPEYSIKTFSQAFAFYTKERKSESLAIVYEDEMGRGNIQEFENQIYHSHEDGGNYRTNIIYKFGKNHTGSPLISDTIEHLHSTISGNFIVKISTVVVFAKPEIATFLLKMMEERFPMDSELVEWVLISNRDFLPSDLTALEHLTHSKITIIQSYKNDTAQSMKRFIRVWNEYKQKECPMCNYDDIDDVTIRNYYMYDGIIHLSTALTRLLLDGNFMSPVSLKCRNDPPLYWDGGSQLIKTIKKTNSSKGALTSISLSNAGFNNIAQIVIMTKESGNHLPFRREMIWNSTNPDDSVLYNPVNNLVLKIVTIEEAPFVNVKRGPDGVKHFHGFCIELIDRLAKNIGFKYEIYEVADNKYGSRMENGSWNGLIGDIIKQKADIVVAGMTITSDREKVVDFTKRFMDYSVGIVIKKPQMTANFFSFIEPFHPSVWFCILSSLILVVVFIYIINKISPNRTTPWKSSESELENTFTFYSVFWFAYSSLMQQGSDLSKPTAPVRIVVAFWWFFTLIVVSSYTANLTAFLTIQRMDTLIQSFRDLSEQHKIKYGTVADTSIFNYIMKKAAEEREETSLFKTMFREINNTENKIKTVSDGFNRASQGGFAFLWDVPVIDYEIENHESCALTSVGDSIYEKGYGFALRQNSNFKDRLSLGILDLQDNGEITRLRNKWWPKMGSCGYKKNPQPAKAELTLQNFTGVFFVLAAGLFLGILFAVMEIIIHIGKGKEYPPTVETLKNDEIEKQRRRPNDIHVVLSKKELVRQLVNDIINDEYKESKCVEAKPSCADEETLIKSWSRDFSREIRQKNINSRSSQNIISRRLCSGNSNTLPFSKTFNKADVSTKLTPPNLPSPKHYEFFPPPPLPVSFEALPDLQPDVCRPIQPHAAQCNNSLFLQSNANCAARTSRSHLYGTLPSVVETGGDELESENTLKQHDDVFLQQLPSLFKKSAV